jgi:hypothetical protein
MASLALNLAVIIVVNDDSNTEELVYSGGSDQPTSLQ